jgi:hypothetical protein
MTKWEDIEPKTQNPCSLLHRRMQELSEQASEATTTRAPPQPDPPTPDDTDPDTNNYTMAILIGVIAVVMLLAVLIAIAVFKRSRQRSAETRSPPPPVQIAVRINFDASVSTLSADSFFLICKSGCVRLQRSNQICRNSPSSVTKYDQAEQSAL